MTLPLFLMALVHDRLRGRRRLGLARPVRLGLFGRTLHTNTVNIAVAAAFAAMGLFIMYLAGAKTMTGGPGFQVAIGDWLARVFSRVEQWTRPVPEWLLGIGVLGIAAILVYATITDRRRIRRWPANPAEPAEPAAACPEHPHQPEDQS